MRTENSSTVTSMAHIRRTNFIAGTPFKEVAPIRSSLQSSGLMIQSNAPRNCHRWKLSHATRPRRDLSAEAAGRTRAAGHTNGRDLYPPAIILPIAAVLLKFSSTVDFWSAIHNKASRHFSSGRSLRRRFAHQAKRRRSISSMCSNQVLAQPPTERYPRTWRCSGLRFRNQGCKTPTVADAEDVNAIRIDEVVIL